MMSDKTETSLNVGLGVWVSFCLLISMWIFTRFMKGKRQMYSNLHVVEDSLARMQEQLDLEQRKKSMGYVENLDEVTACLKKFQSQEEHVQTQGDQDAGDDDKLLQTTQNEAGNLSQEESVEEADEDKKHV